jgi:hypothetical protein
MTNNNHDASSASTKKYAGTRYHFYVKRQQFLDEITFDHGNAAVPALTAFVKNVGRMIAKSINPNTGESFESASSFARRLGGKTKVRHVENAMKVLEARDWLRIEQRGSRVSGENRICSRPRPSDRSE